MAKKLRGGKKPKIRSKKHFLDPCNFLTIAYSKKVKTLLYSKSGARSMMRWRKLRKNIVFTQNHEISHFY